MTIAGEGRIGEDADVRSTARALGRLAERRQVQGRYGASEKLYRRALALAEAAFPGDLETAALLNGLGVLHKYQGRYGEAEPLYRRALAIVEASLGPDHPETASLYHNLGGLEHARGRAADGEPWARRSVEIRERACGPDHPAVAADKAALAAILDAQGRFDEAEALYGEALAVFERVYGPEHYELAVNYNNLAAIRQAKGEAGEAETLYRRALEIKEKVLGDRHPDTALTLHNLATLLAGFRPDGGGRGALRPRPGRLRERARKGAPAHGGLPGGIGSARRLRVTAKPGGHLFRVAVRREDRIENLFDHSIPRHEGDPFHETGARQLEGGEQQRVDPLEALVAQQLEGEMEPLDRLALVLRILRAEAEDPGAELPAAPRGGPGTRRTAACTRGRRGSRSTPAERPGPAVRCGDRDRSPSVPAAPRDRPAAPPSRGGGSRGAGGPGDGRRRRRPPGWGGRRGGHRGCRSGSWGGCGHPSPRSWRDSARMTFRASARSSGREEIASTRCRIVLGRRPKRRVICWRSTFRISICPVRSPSSRPSLSDCLLHSCAVSSSIGASVRSSVSEIITPGNVLWTSEIHQSLRTRRISGSSSCER